MPKNKDNYEIQNKIVYKKKKECVTSIDRSVVLIEIFYFVTASFLHSIYYSNSIVPGGLLVISNRTLFT